MVMVHEQYAFWIMGLWNGNNSVAKNVLYDGFTVGVYRFL